MLNTHEQTKKYFNIQRGEEKMSEWSTRNENRSGVRAAVEDAVELLGEKRVINLDKSYETSYNIINSVRAF